MRLLHVAAWPTLSDVLDRVDLVDRKRTMSATPGSQRQRPLRPYAHTPTRRYTHLAPGRHVPLMAGSAPTFLHEPLFA
jgi:hypothetical protein